MSSLHANPKTERPARPLAEGAKWRTKLLTLLASLLLVTSLLYKLDEAPALWWDEGWTLMLARNWVEQGFFGQIMDGQRLPPGLAASPIVAAPVVLSFRLFGVGAWQGRLPFVLFTLANLALMFYIARRLYPRPVAWGMLFVMMIMPIGAGLDLHPIVIGRQVLGEMPAIFFILLGMVLFERALKKPVWWGIPACVSWGLALNTKAQVMPFWLASTSLVLLLTLINGWRRLAVITTLTILGTLVTAQLIFPRLQNFLLAESTLPTQPLSDIYQTIALVTDLQVRLFAVGIVLSIGLLTLIGLVYATWGALKSLRKENPHPERSLLCWAMLGFSGSWMVWYICLAMYWTRYLFPVCFLGSLFTAAMLYDLTHGFNIRRTFHEAGQVLSATHTGKKDRWVFISRLLNLLIIVLLISYSALSLVNLAIFVDPNSPQIVASYLRETVSPDDLIETYDTELMFLLGDRRFHYPPDQVSVDQTRRLYINRSTGANYDPLAANPDYLVVGPYSRFFQLYDPLETSSEFALIKEFPGYKIYIRTRR
jgi:hypothetical protein